MKNFTLTLGKTKEYYLKAFKAKGISVSHWAKNLIDHMPFDRKKQTIEVEIVTVAQLGLPGGTTKEIYDAAALQGYGIVPAEAALALLLAYLDQSIEEIIRIGMELITDSDGDLGKFLLDLDRCNGNLWLDDSYVHSSYYYSDDRLWAFQKPPFLKNSQTNQTNSFSCPHCGQKIKVEVL